MPSVLVKGADYDAKETDEAKKTYIVGSKEVNAQGGRTVTIPLEVGYSTTNLVNRMKNS
jgi:bifunctional ADP-heptose synthase (sugar kinase/adenylyltransferase)